MSEAAGARRITAALCAPAALALLALAAASSFLSWVPPWLAMAAAFLPLAVLPSLLLFALALWSRTRAPIILSAAALLALALIYAPVFIPHEPPAEATYSNPVRVMAWNVGWQTSGPGLVDPIRDSDAIVVAVQESRHATAQTLQNELGDVYPHQLFEARHGMTVLLSRYPIVYSDWFSLPGDPWPSLEAVINWNGVPLTVMVPHTTWPRFYFYEDTILPTGFEDGLRVELAAEIVRRAQAAPGPILVMGDLNMTDRNPAYRVLTRELADVHRQAGSGFGFTWPVGLTIRGIPVPGPILRIDYVLASRDIVVLSAEVECNGASDHCYVLAEVARTAP